MFEVTLQEDESEIPEESELQSVERYIDIRDLTLEKDNVFEILAEDRDGLKAGSIVQKDIVQRPVRHHVGSLKRLTVHAGNAWSETVVPDAQNDAFFETWHSLALRAFMFSHFEQLETHIEGCTPLVSDQIRHYKGGGDRRAWDEVVVNGRPSNAQGSTGWFMSLVEAVIRRTE